MKIKPLEFNVHDEAPGVVAYAIKPYIWYQVWFALGLWKWRCNHGDANIAISEAEAKERCQKHFDNLIKQRIQYGN